MMLWTIKQLSTVRQAMAGRKYPHQLAWAVAFGLLLGIVPHGNLLALSILFIVLSLKLNHAMAGLTAVVVTFIAARLDQYSHQVGDYVLTHPQLGEGASMLWQLPMMPWTDLNNTVVMGSFLIGLVALVPVFALTYPIFRWLAPSSDSDPDDATARQADDPDLPSQSAHEVIMVDRGHDHVSSPHRTPNTVPHQAGQPTDDRSADLTESAESTEHVVFEEVDPDLDHESDDSQIAVETRIDVIRMVDHRRMMPERASAEDDVGDDQQPMDEALNYLLRQLRDSQQRKKAA
jgi:uncharacterized protein (TIGR03546 family)